MNVRALFLVVTASLVTTGCRTIDLPMYSNAWIADGLELPFLTNCALIKAELADPRQEFDFGGLKGKRWDVAQEMEAIAQATRRAYTKDAAYPTSKHDAVLMIGEIGFVFVRWALWWEQSVDARGKAAAQPDLLGRVRRSLARLQNPALSKVVEDSIDAIVNPPASAPQEDQILVALVKFRDLMKQVQAEAR